MGNVNKMKEKWANKEAKVWFMEAQKWTQQWHPFLIHLFSCIVEICLTNIGFNIPCVVLVVLESSL
jgi:hypothetical protein